VRCGNLFRKEAWFTSLVTVLRARMSAKLLTKKLKEKRERKKEGPSFDAVVRYGGMTFFDSLLDQLCGVELIN
jgi:hypothetical protein